MALLDERVRKQVRTALSINEVIHIEGAVPENVLGPELMKVEDEAAMTQLRAQSQ